VLRTIAIALISLFVTASGWAQIPTSGNIFFGYSYNHASFNAGGSENQNGWDGSLEGKIFPFIGLVADVSGLYGSHDSIHSAIFGPRVSVSVGKLTPFAHVLIGVSHFSSAPDSETSFADAFGGGIDYRLIRPIAWRFQLDDLQTRFFSTRQDDFRFSTGLVLRF
jgi:hypothetical protein